MKYFLIIFIILLSSCKKEEKVEKKVPLDKTQITKVLGDLIKKQDDIIVKFKENYNKEKEIKINYIKSRTYGKDSAPYHLVVYSDFYCGHCKTSSTKLKEIVDESEGKVKLSYIIFPLNYECNSNLKKGKISDYSCHAMKLSLCAEKEGKFFEALNYLYENKTSKAEEFNIKNFTDKMSKDLSLKDLNSCMNSKFLEEKIKEENSLYKDMEIKGTPTVYLNSKRITSHYYKNKKLFFMFLDVLEKDSK